MTDSERHELELLASAMCDGGLPPEQLERLEEMLRDSEECRAFYLQYLDMHARLTVHPSLASGIPLQAEGQREDDEAVMELARKSLDGLLDSGQAIRRRRFVRSLGTFAALALLVAVGWRLFDQSTRSQLPVIKKLVGEVVIESGASSSIARIGRRLRPGERMRLGADESRAELNYDDGTKVIVYFNSLIEVPRKANDAQLRLLAGTMEVDAAPQPPDDPMVFATDHARYSVLGTQFRLYRETTASRLELDEGKVRVERDIDGETLEVSAGFVSVASADRTPLSVQPLAAGRGELQATLVKGGDDVAFSRDGEWLATSHRERGLKTWPRLTIDPDDSHRAKLGRSDGLTFVDGAVVHVNSEKKGVATHWRPGEKAKRLSLPGRSVRSRALSPDGAYTVESGERGTFVYRLDWNRRKRKTVGELPGPGKAWCMSLAHAGRFVAAGYWNGLVRVYRVSPEVPTPMLAPVEFETKFTHTPTRIALSEDATRLAVFSRDDGLRLIDLADGRELSLWSGGGARVSCLRFSRDGQRVIAGLSDRTARMWAVADGRALLVLDVGHTPRAVAWSSELSLFATANGNVKLWQYHIQ